MNYEAKALSRMCNLTRHRANIVTAFGVNRHNLKIETSLSLTAINPRKDSLTLWVGVDVLISKLSEPLIWSGIDEGIAKALNESLVELDTIEVLVDRYITANLLNKDDYYYMGVTNDHEGWYIPIEIDSEYNESYVHGFLMISKDELRESHKLHTKYVMAAKDFDTPYDDKWDDAKAMNVMRSIAKDELDAYCSWMFDSIFNIKVSTLDGQISRMRMGVFGMADVVVDTYDEVIAEVAHDILLNDTSMTLVFTYDKEAFGKNITNTNIIEYVMNEFQGQYGFVPAVGLTKFDDDIGSAMVVFLASDIPHLKDLVPMSDMFDSPADDFKNNFITRILADDKEGLSYDQVDDMVDSLVSSDTPVHELSFDLNKNVILAMIDTIDYVEMDRYHRYTAS